MKQYHVHTRVSTNTIPRIGVPVSGVISGLSRIQARGVNAHSHHLHNSRFGSGSKEKLGSGIKSSSTLSEFVGIRMISKWVY